MIKNYVDIKQFLKDHYSGIMLGIIILCVAGSLLMIASQGAQTKSLVESSQITSKNTNQIVKSQDDILNAIKKVTLDNRLSAEQQTTIIICMLQVPLSERTTDTATACRKTATTTVTSFSVSKEDNTTTTPTTPKKSSTVPASSIPTSSNSLSTPSSGSGSTSNSRTPAPKPEQKKLLNCTVDLLSIHIGC